MTRGKIVLVPFPFDDLSTSKVRPAVCLTEPTGPQRELVIVLRWCGEDHLFAQYLKAP